MVYYYCNQEREKTTEPLSRSFQSGYKSYKKKSLTNKEIYVIIYL